MATVTKAVKVKDAIKAMIPEEWKDDQAFLTLVQAIHTTAYMHLAIHAISKYMDERRIDKPEKLVHEEPRLIGKYLMDYLSNREIENNSKRVEKALLKKFFSQNDVVLNWEKIGSVIGKREKNKNRGYKLEEIRQMLSHAPDLRCKMVILLLASSGIRIEALSTLDIGNLKAIEHEGYKFYAITVYEGDPEEYVTFCSPECASVIDGYLEFRKRIKEPLKPSSPLVRDQIDIETAMAKPSKRIGQRVGKRGLEHLLREVILESGVRQKLKKTIDKGGSKVRYEAHTSRGFRKFFYTRLVEARIEPIHREYMHGHLDGSNNLDSTNLMMVYTTPEDTDLFKSYLKAVDLLTINEGNRLKRQLEQKQKLDEKTLKQTIQQMIEQYLAKRQQLAVDHSSMTEEELAEKIDQVEKLNPISKLGIDVYLDGRLHSR